MKNGVHRVEFVEDLVKDIKIMQSKSKEFSHYGFPINWSSLTSYFSNPQRFRDCFIFGYYINNEPVSAVWWIRVYDARVNKKIIQEYAWLSDRSTKRYGVILFKKSLEYIKNVYKFDVVLLGNSEKNPKIEKFYTKNGFKLEGNLFYKSN